MRLSRLMLAAALVLALGVSARADDTEDFLSPDNWQGRGELFKLDAKAKTIVGETMEDPKYNTFFATKKKYGDFELSCKILLRDGVGNSGIQIRSVLKDDKKFVVHGPQVDVGKGYFGALYGEGVGGYLLKPKKDAAKPTEANEYKIVVKGNHVTITLNGEVTVDEDFPDNKAKNPAPAEGVIALQIHGGYPKMKVEVTDIKFTDLSKK
ncbi:Uncharacterized protein OS=Isosphaera pallida (strain ATCC 43644 / DSM 9630 / IS1B) GN=Isop_3656 PE=4 SV=1: DUF1080 [Gemmataceae bacterium]|nr:Uncharacterized protein OS=Isosphaera pallida (strain ATCC 43644 / DSM 9630 / IS1B) GN=Isop_3656 PE=4 SV=1: DUF1080 [Gemmataceae bacterium]VTU00102.1 Uncharacterized protein OS=Isosphaera pallida (strain ATCC 43644 / DSM 9630 / IS1B) GN=Isop_3656 PE=4 SV=1: DUF1080 [Gemmataceae bacterium]